MLELISLIVVKPPLLNINFEDMLRLVHCKHPSVRYCWSRTHDSTLEIAFFHRINKRLDIGLVIKKFYPVLLVLSIGQTKSYVTYIGLTVLVAGTLVNTALDLLGLLLTLTSERYRAYLAIRNHNFPLPIPMTGKRRRGSEGDVVGIVGIRRQEIDATNKREQSKRKWVDDLDDRDVVGIGRIRRQEIDATINREQSKRKWVDEFDGPSPMDYSSKKSRLWSFHLPDVLQWSKGNRRATRSKASRARRYMYRWVPRRPPWYTLRVYKRYALLGNPRRRRVRYSERQIQGLENFLSNYDPPFNVFCLDDLRASLPCISPPPDTADTSAKICSAPPMPPANQSNQPRGSGEKDDDEDEYEEL